jgi:Protein of unknown function (DUF3455)
MNYRSKGTLLGILPFVAILLAVTIALSAARLLAQAQQAPSMIAVSGEVPTAILHAEGAQIYQCESDSHDHLAWQPREPIASLILDGDTVGRHYAGLHWGHIDYAKFQWEHADGSAVQARIVASAAAASPDDIPWLRLDVTSQTGNGALYGVTAVQRINTRGGMARGSCEKAGSYLGVPFSADYVFWRED